MTKLLAIVSLILMLSFASQAQYTNALSVSSETVPGELVVKFKGKYGDQHTKRMQAKLKGRSRFHHSMTGINIHHLVVTDGESETDLIAELNQSGDVEYAEPNYVIHLSQDPGGEGQILSAGDVQTMSAGGGGSYSQDSANVMVTQSWAYATAKNKVVVAVLDTGVDYNHYVLTGTAGIWSNKNEVVNGLDDDGNGYVDDVRGWNFAYGNNNPMDDNGHGTHVSGIIVGVGQNIFSGSLSASNIQVMPLKFMDSSGTGSTATAVSAVYYAVANGARVLNNSWGGSGYAQSLNDALNYAYNHGVFIASAAGNYSTNDDSSPLYPASLTIPSMITVAATDNYDNLAGFSSYGVGSVQVAAPGVSILSTYPGNSFAYLSGTSMASPFVAGLAAQVFSQAPQLTGYQVRQIIVGSVDVKSALASAVSSSGRVNASTSVQAAVAATSTQAYQPVFAEVIPAGVSTGQSQTSSAGCGTVSISTLSSAFWSKGGGSGGSSPGALGSVFVLLFLPLAVWMVVRTKWVTPSRRRYGRFATDSEVRVYRDGQELLGRLSSISLGGAAFSAQSNLNKGELVTLQIAIPSQSNSIEVMGRVVWNDDNQSYGVQFGPLGDQIIDQLRQWTRQLVTED